MLDWKILASWFWKSVILNLTLPKIEFICSSYFIYKYIKNKPHWYAHVKHCWERLKVGGEGDDRGWDGWMTSPTQWTWVWVSSGIWWWTGRPGLLQSIGSQSRTQPSDWTELNWTALFLDFAVVKSQFQENGQNHAFSIKLMTLWVSFMKKKNLGGIFNLFWDHWVLAKKESQGITEYLLFI